MQANTKPDSLYLTLLYVDFAYIMTYITSVNKIVWSKKAQKQLLKINQKDAEYVYDKVGELESFPSCQQVKKLRNHQYAYRLRVGRYRVLLNHDRVIKIISIEEVRKRDERTY